MSILPLACEDSSVQADAPSGSTSGDPPVGNVRDSGADPDPNEAGADAGLSLPLPPGALSPTTPVMMTANRTWQWVPTPDARCIDGSSTGFGVNFNADAPDKLMIYFEGGGLCFTAETCENNTANRDGYGEAQFDAQVKNANVQHLSTIDAANPVRDYSMAYIPYCTGDLHAGDNETGLTFNGRNYRFFGWRNAALYLSRILATWPNAKSVVVMGASAGGYGATFNFERISRAWGDPPNAAQTILINDSGPFLGDNGFAPCMQLAMRDAYRFDKTAMAACPDCLANANGSDVFARFFDYLLARPLPSTSRIGFITSTQDIALRQLASVGRSAACDLSNVFLFPPPDSEVAVGTILTRTQSSKLVHFVVDDTEAHTFLGSPPLAQTAVSGVTLQSWLAAAVVGGSAFADLGP